MERFYSKVNQTVHNRNLLRSSIATEEKAEVELEKKTVRDTENKIRKNATRAEYVRRLRADRAAEAIQITSDLEPVVEFLPEQPARISTKVDLQLLSAVKERMKLGLPVDAFILRVLLIALLSVHNKLSLLKENGGKNTFRDPWATRFYKRHKLKRRAATTKMRILPSNFEELKEAYIRIYSAAVNKYKIPRELNIGGDETNLLFVPRALFTYAFSPVNGR